MVVRFKVRETKETNVRRKGGKRIESFDAYPE